MSESTTGKHSGLLTEGVIWKQLLLFSLPLLLGNLFQLLYNTVDSIVVGNFIGGNALAAVGASNPIINLLVGLFMGLATGAGVIISKFFGGQRLVELRKSVHTAVGLALCFGLVLMIFGTLLAPMLLKMVGTPEEVFSGGVIYLQIYFLGIIPMTVYNMGSGILRSVGDSKMPLVYLAVSCVVNIVLDLLFVIVFQMGIAGVAWATLVAQAVSAFLVMRKLLVTKESYRFYWRELRMDVPILKEMVKVGLPTGLQQAIISVSNIVVQANINMFGAAAIAGCAAYVKIDGLVALPFNSFALAVTTFTSQNIGAGNFDRVKQGMRVCMKMNVLLTAGLSVVMLTCGKFILRVFSGDQQILYYANYMLYILAPCYIFIAIAQTYSGVVRGAGRSLAPMIILAGNMCGVRMIWIALAMPLMNSILVVFIGYSLTWATSALCMWIYCKKVNWLYSNFY